jgi:hypothetical protein
MHTDRTATIHLVERDPTRDGVLTLYEVAIAITPERDQELDRRDKHAIRAVVNGCRRIISGHQAEHLAR